ncbi:MAG: ATP synthase epsilon chain [Candidatus Nomurabacteria bacterium GW2011_GWA1_37_20]|uniref:ATP synthase epsilon chain n=1 Tax=Candidatus Nomurabacteria bacterium GW2011_GWA1_37_20 TaxID=1618729 RepID=A0A0G0JAJ3_9BACT|nr:MAG: ATP synthase epsilon chain [Parcubacteria group bacterium GW2011_GWC1_36_9]KKQ27177.1 MAG: ATP synthase epsilon chain [Parcubacteria group bacterium GW2011_GWB1_37_13]KKQ33709.1 MAG: ATP synthase epsilon chain [Candidatus Nomurabacteria bacterium GW2011_GWA1_37_20]
MSKQLKLKIVTPERLILEEMVDQVSLPTTEGEITVLPDHIPLITGLSSGDVIAVANGEYVPMAIVEGFVEVKNLVVGVPSGTPTTITEVAVLADFAEHVSELSEEKIVQAKARAEELKKLMENKEHVDFEHFEAELERSLTRVKIADKWRTKKYRK